MDFETFAAQHGHDRFAMDVAVQRLPGASIGVKHRILADQLTKIKENYEHRELLRKEYDCLVADGKIRSPTHMEQIEAAAQGNPENEQTKAALRLIEKYKKRGIMKLNH